MYNIYLGTDVDAPKNSVFLDASAFNRHTFWCGQSGSGKTYALGILLERLILHTQLPIVVLDPNSDFSKLDSPVDPSLKQAFDDAEIQIFGSETDHSERLSVRFTSLSAQAKAAVLQLDPIRDADEYNAFIKLDASIDALPTEKLSGRSYRDILRDGDDPVRNQLATRIENLGILSWDIWSFGKSSSLEESADNTRVTVLDLGVVSTREQQQIAAIAYLENLWENRMTKQPTLIVAEEAHNFCAPNPTTELERHLLNLFIKIAAEGRKYGLWLLLSTQRPSKIDSQILSQCDNVGLLRLNSQRDQDEIADFFSFLPPPLIRRLTGIPKGQVLFGGRFVDTPRVVATPARYTEEGGSDVPVPVSPPSYQPWPATHEA